ncbi:MAG: hypothetical protein ACXWTS_03530 [Methylococcaceae bacterium]
MIVFYGVSDEPDIKLGWTLSHGDILRAKKILHEGSKSKPDEIGTIELSKGDLNLAANYLLNRYSKSAVNISIKENKLKFTVTTTLPENSLGKYLNITFRLGNVDGNPLPSITKFKAGALLLPANLAAYVIDLFIRHSSLNEYFILATRPIKAVKIEPEKVTITYFSNIETLIQARNFLTSSDNYPALNVYHKKLADIVSQHDPNWRLSLAELLQPLFALAYQRSTLATAIEENRMAILAVNDYVNKHETHKFLSSGTKNPAKHKQYPAFLYKRIDLAQHFIASAAITASVNGEVSKVVGEEKELSDAQSGSGFSFIDLAADKAGTRFGEMATSKPEIARKIQKVMSEIKDYRAFMPDPRDLPEHMDQAEFKQRFGSPSHPDYHKISEQIDDRIAAMPIYKLD